MNTRKFSRVKFRVDATIRISDRTFTGKVENISMSGMFMLTGERLQLGDQVDIAITLTGSVPSVAVGFSGSVSRVVDDGLGFTFSKIDLDSYTHLKNIVAYNIDDAEKVIDEIHHAIDEKIVAET